MSFTGSVPRVSLAKLGTTKIRLERFHPVQVRLCSEWVESNENRTSTCVHLAGGKPHGNQVVKCRLVEVGETTNVVDPVLNARIRSAQCAQGHIDTLRWAIRPKCSD